ncbi:AIPR family protein [Mycolicibacterium sp. P9-22]|uniref:AIPR family protein n=1 Tax=Mycolicibacterium sp. P9-22 TaxID=2024613 RepID=UPI001D14A5D8|nr:AIPR family protein [Mycolicibacterium sp. P9-22]
MAGKADSDLRDSCAFYAQKYKYPSDALEKGLEGYVAHLFAQEEGFDAVLDGELTTEVDLSDYICRGNDLKIDAVLEDEIGKRILLLQAAWRAKDLEESKVAAFFDVPDLIVRGEYKDTGGDQIQELIADFSTKVADGWEVILRFCTNLSVGNRKRLQEVVDAKNEAYLQEERSVTCELLGGAELSKWEEELKSAIRGGLVNEVSLHLQEGKYIELSDPYRSVIGVIKANELVSIYKQKGVGLALFNLNIRLPLASKKVNPKIVETAASEDEGSNFLYYNNGVSAVCSGYELNGNLLTAQRLQIINGAQTVSALVRAARKYQNPDVYLLFRLTETEEKYGGAFTDNVIRYNNTQNPVKVADFFANDQIQIWLRDNLTRIAGHGAVPNLYYVHKSGHKPKGATGRGLKIEQLAGIRHAFLYGPVASYKEPASFFDRGSRYDEAFGIGGKPVTFWPEEELMRAGAALAIHERIQALGKKLKQDDLTKDSDEAKYLYRLARYVTALVSVGLEAIREKTFKDYSTLMASNPTFSANVDPIISKARQALRHEYKAKKAKSVQPEYNLARDDEAWSRLRDAVREEVVADYVLG